MVYIHFIVYGVYLFLFVLISRYELKKYKKNNPYTPPKKKGKFFRRFFLGIIGGLYYSHFIGTYNHKKYNTQVFTPKTFECHVAGTLAGVFVAGYVVASLFLFKFFGIIGFSILLVPIVLNLISIYIDKKNRS